MNTKNLTKNTNEAMEVKNMNRKETIKEKIAKTVLYVNVACMGMLLSLNSVQARGSNTESIDGFITFICDWLLKIGGVVALIGGVMFAFGWQRDDAEGKTRGLTTMMAGFMVIAISQAPDIFGL